MNYTKPEVAVLGQAVRVIEQLFQGKTVPSIDRWPDADKLNPAYDLDE